jgi:beta-1,4-mannosyl-glycoprotein beta-1,4-N-acetylglucosaminyltransferase
MNKIIDGFIFYNELDLLDFRLEYLYDYVDYFIIVEGELTFIGNKKPLYYENNKHLFEKYKDKIIHVILKEEDLINLETGDKERKSRNSINIGIQKLNLSNNDIINICDIDEIPNRNILYNLKNTNLENNISYKLIQDFYYYNLNCINFKEKWKSSVLLNYFTYKNYFNCMPQELRVKVLFEWIPKELIKEIENGGWHFSFFGNSKTIANKLENYCHQEFNKKEIKNKENIDNCIKNNISFITNKEDNPFTYISIQDNKNLPEGYERLLNDKYSLFKD